MDALSYHPDVLNRGPVRVHAVFRRAWHLHDREGWVLTVTCLPYNGPLGIRVPCLPPLAPGTLGELSGNLLRVGGLEIGLERAVSWPPPARLPLYSIEILAGQRALVRSCMSEGLPLDALNGALSPAPTAAVRSLVGRGGGLTPAGDDALVGMLATLHRFDMPFCRLEREVEESLYRTASLSRTLLRYAMRGLAVEPLQHVLWSLGQAGGLTSLDRLLAVGHTSGRDMLAGVWAALGALLEERR